MASWNDKIASKETLMNVTGWLLNAPKEVGDAVTGLHAAPTTGDKISRAGSSTQIYTSWNTISRGYVAGVRCWDYSVLRQQPLQLSTDIYRGDIPTEAEKSTWSKATLKFWTTGVGIYKRGVGVLTRKQIERCIREGKLSPDGTYKPAQQKSTQKSMNGGGDQQPGTSGTKSPTAPKPEQTIKNTIDPNAPQKDEPRSETDEEEELGSVGGSDNKGKYRWLREFKYDGHDHFTMRELTYILAIFKKYHSAGSRPWQIDDIIKLAMENRGYNERFAEYLGLAYRMILFIKLPHETTDHVDQAIQQLLSEESQSFERYWDDLPQDFHKNWFKFPHVGPVNDGTDVVTPKGIHKQGRRHKRDSKQQTSKLTDDQIAKVQEILSKPETAATLKLEFDPLKQFLESVIEDRKKYDGQTKIAVDLTHRQWTPGSVELEKCMDKFRREYHFAENLKPIDIKYLTKTSDFVINAGEPLSIGDRTGEMQWISEYIPMRVFAVTTYITLRERSIPVLYSPLYKALEAKLIDPTQTSLSTMVRGTNIRDAASMLSLAKYIRQSSASKLEMAPLLRLGLFMVSLGLENYMYEILPYRFIRRWTREADSTIVVLPRLGINRPNLDMRAIAVPLDAFCEFCDNKWSDEMPQDFGYENMDITYAVVPISSQFFNQSASIPYVLSFLHTKFWAGRVNILHQGSCMTEGMEKTKRVNYTEMPASNSIVIPGPLRVMFVLVDYTSNNGLTYIQWQGEEIPIWNKFFADPNNIEIPNLFDVFNRWFTTANVATDKIQANTVSAWKHLCTQLAVENVCATVLGLIADCYTTLYHGFSVQPSDTEPDYDFDKEADGCWSWGGGTLGHNSRVKTYDWTEDDDLAHKKFTQRTIGYNFSSLTSFHKSTGGIAPTMRFDAINVNEGCFCGWIHDDNEQFLNMYNISTMPGPTRVATYIGLILTHENTYNFSNLQAYSGWVHMLATAMSLNTAVMFSSNQVSLPTWTGYQNTYDTQIGLEISVQLTDELSNGLINHIDLRDMSEFNEWDEDMVSVYYGLDPMTDQNWMSTSPMPFPTAWQWMMKLQLPLGVKPNKTSYFWHDGTTHKGITLDPSNMFMTAMVYGTIDFDKYMPIMTKFTPDNRTRHMSAWLDQHSYLTNVSVGSKLRIKPDVLSSEVVVPNIINNGLLFRDDNKIYILHSDAQLLEDITTELRGNMISFPDPLTWKSVWEGLKNWVISPALHAIGGFVTGGPAGAAVAGASALADKIVTATVPEQAQEKVKSEVKNTIQTVAEEVKQAKDRQRMLKEQFPVPEHNQETHHQQRPAQQPQPTASSGTTDLETADQSEN